MTPRTQHEFALGDAQLQVTSSIAWNTWTKAGRDGGDGNCQAARHPSTWQALARRRCRPHVNQRSAFMHTEMLELQPLKLLIRGSSGTR